MSLAAICQRLFAAPVKIRPPRTQHAWRTMPQMRRAVPSLHSVGHTEKPSENRSPVAP
jgi:hypothetical protein